MERGRIFQGLLFAARFAWWCTYISPVDSCFFIYLKHLPAKLYLPANIHLGRNYPFFVCWGKHTFHCEKHISDKTSITKDIRHCCIFLLFISYVYYTRCHWHFYSSLLFIFILLCNFYGHGLVVLRQWGLRFHNTHLRAKRNLRIAIQTFVLEQMALFSASMRRISTSFWCERILQCQH